MTERNQLSATEQPDPIVNSKPPVWELVIKDMQDRDEWGRSKYNAPLQPFNGRNSLVDLYQELLDATVYCRQIIEELKTIGPLYDAMLKLDLSSLTPDDVQFVVTSLESRTQ